MPMPRSSSWSFLVEDECFPGVVWHHGHGLFDLRTFVGLYSKRHKCRNACGGRARAYFQGACEVFGEFLDNPFNAALVEGRQPLPAPFNSRYKSGRLDLGRLPPRPLRRRPSQFDRFPTATKGQLRLFNLGSQVPGPLLNDIRRHGDRDPMRLLLASPFQNLPVYSTSAAGQITAIRHATSAGSISPSSSAASLLTPGPVATTSDLFA